MKKKSSGKSRAEESVSIKALQRKKDLTDRAAKAAEKLLDAIKARHKSLKKACKHAKKAAKKARRELEKALKKHKPAKVKKDR